MTVDDGGDLGIDKQKIVREIHETVEEGPEPVAEGEAQAVVPEAGPLTLGEWLRELENSHGRDRGAPRWSSRTLDIDILLYGDLWLVSPALEIPRGEILTTAHVLKPLADLAPGLVHPAERLTLFDLWEKFPEPHPRLQAVSL